jgi:chromosome segregation ATPase
LTLLKARRLAEFQVGFRGIAEKLKETYQILTSGGDAELDYEDH